MHTRTPRRGIVAATLTVALGLGAAVLAPAVPVEAVAPADLRPVVLDSGHIDLFELTYDDGTSALDLRVKDDTRLYDLGKEFRSPETVTVAVDQEQAGFTPEEVPPGFESILSPGETVYILDSSQVDGLPWPGWSTERLTSTLPDGVEIAHEQGTVEFAVEVDGPGDVITFVFGDNGPENMYINTTDDHPDVIQATTDIHYHTAWVFTEPGDYELMVTPSAHTTTGATLTGPARSFHFHVGPRPSFPTLPDGFTADIEGVPATVTPNQSVDLDLALGGPQPSPGLIGSYQWYRWVDDEGYVKIPGATAAELTANVSPYDQLYVTILDTTGRVMTDAYTSFLPVPGPPHQAQNVTGSADGNEVSVSWATPGNGNSPLTGYEITLTSASQQVLTKSLPPESYEAIFPRVPAGTWTATVRASNALGSAPLSDPSLPFDITQKLVSVSAATIDQVYGRIARLRVVATQGATGTVKVKAGSRTISGTLVNGVATVSVPRQALAPGRRTVSIIFDGVAGQFSSATGQATVRVRKARAALTVRRITPTVGRGELATFRVRTTAFGVRPTGSVTVRVAGKRRTVRLDATGRATVTLRIPSATSPGRKSVLVTYHGDRFVARGTQTSTIGVHR